MRTPAIARRPLRLLAATLLAVAPAAGGAPFALEEVLAYPHPSPPVAAEDAPRIAWSENLAGSRTLWTAAAPDFAPVRLTAPTPDDGQPLHSLALTADGSILVWVRGGGPNAAGELPNPASDPAAVEQAIWAVETAGGEPWRLAGGGSFALFPGSDAVAVVADGEVFRAALEPPAGEGGAAGEGEGEGQGEAREAAAAAVELEPLFAVRRGVSDLTVSPDGGRIAFASDRGHHGLVGVFDVDERRITWMAPGVDRDSRPVFSPDGSRLAYLRWPGLKAGELSALTEAHWFAVLVGDPATGEAREVWRSPDSGGGFAQFYPERPLAWAGDDRLVFTSEHHGWLHAYALPVDGGGGPGTGPEPVDLTPGEALAEWTAVSPDGGTLFFSGNHDDVDRRHLWRAPVEGGRAEALTAGDGIETGPTPLAGGEWLALRAADARRPPAIAVMPVGGGQRHRVGPELPEAFPLDDLVEPEPLVLTADDGVRAHAQLFAPPGATSPGETPAGGRPAVVFLHGGPVRQMLLGWHYRGYYARAYAFNQYLASRGAVVLSLNFRSGIGYGQAFRLAPGQGPRGATEYQDLLAAGLHLRRRADVDGERIGLWGGSYGGYLTALGLARDSDLFAAGVDLHGVHDWAWRGRHFPVPGGYWGLGEDDLDLAWRSSPVADLGTWSSPVLLVHGDDDRNVEFVQTVDLARRLAEEGVETELLVFPDEVHGFLRHASWVETFRRAAVVCAAALRRQEIAATPERN